MVQNNLGAPVYVVNQTVPVGGNTIPDVLVTGGGVNGVAPRLRVDVGQTGFFSKKEFRSLIEFSQPLGTSLPNGQRVLFRVISPINFILMDFRISADNGQIRCTTYAGGTPTGTFSTALPIIPANSMTEGPPAYTPQITISMAGPGLPAAVDLTGGVLRDVLRLKVENSTGSAATVGADQDSERGLPAFTYYILLENIGTGVFEGVIYCRWEERP